jgi:hypothetical protein
MITGVEEKDDHVVGGKWIIGEQTVGREGPGHIPLDQVGLEQPGLPVTDTLREVPRVQE